MKNQLIITASKEQLKKEVLPESLQNCNFEFRPEYSNEKEFFILIGIDHFRKDKLLFGIMIQHGQHYTGKLINKDYCKILNQDNEMAKLKKEAGTETATETKTTNKSIFVDGLSIFPPHEKAPDFVKGKVKINFSKFEAWMQANEDKLTDYKGDATLTLQLKESKSGDLYMDVDTYGTEFAKG